MRTRSVLGAALLLLTVLGCSQTNPGPGERVVTVAAAADLQFALDEVLAEFHRAHPGIRAEVSYGSSGNFFAQLSNHAPFDIFFSADIDYPRRLVAEVLARKDIAVGEAA